MHTEYLKIFLDLDAWGAPYKPSVAELGLGQIEATTIVTFQLLVAGGGIFG